MMGKRLHNLILVFIFWNWETIEPDSFEKFTNE